MKIDLTGKNALIGGSSKGIGLGIATQLANSGASVCLIARNESKLKEILNQLENEGRIAFKYFNNLNNKYNYNPNGSVNDIAGILSKNGKVLGMMPHPERAINTLHGGTDGLKFLTKCVEKIIG